MKAKPLLVALAAFAIVLLGGAAMAGIGTYMNSDESQAADYTSGDTSLTLATTAPKQTTTSIAHKAPEPEPVKEEKAEHEDSAKIEEPEAEEEPKEVVDKPASVFTLTHPEDGAHLKAKVVAFGGEASNGVIVHRGKYEAIPHDGTWAMELVLSPGKNHVSFEGIDADGNVILRTVTVHFDAPADEGKDTTAPFVAHQKYGSCGEEVPYDIFYGTAQPGAKISASSEYGSNSTTANDDGKWEMKVTFPDAPSGKTFNVKIKASTGQSKTFSFTNTGGGEDH